MHKYYLTGLVGLLGLGLLGCAATRPAAIGTPGQLSQSATIELSPRLTEGRHVLALRPVYKATDIASLSVTPYVLAPGSVYKNIDALTGEATDSTSAGILWLTQASPSIDLTKKLRFSNLKPQKTYKIIARAYNTAGTLISSDASSTVIVSVATSESPTFNTLPLKLVDTTFGATASIAILNDATSSVAVYESSVWTVAGGVATPVSGATASIPVNLSNFYVTNLSGSRTYRIMLTAFDAFLVPLATGSTDIVIDQDDEIPGATISLEIPT